MSNISYGFTPRIYPRPIYPSFITLIWSFIKGCFIEGVLLCTIISYIFYIPYQNSINKIKNILSLKYDNDQFIFTILLSSTHIIIWCLVNIPLYIFDKYGYYQKSTGFFIKSAQPKSYVFQVCSKNTKDIH